VPRGLDYRADVGAALRSATGMAIMGVGLIVDPHHAESLLAAGQANLVAIGREALYNPNWALHAEIALGANQAYASWPLQYRMWLERRAPVADPVRAAGIARMTV
jgi:2,4-dienoyl-CoA reductase-like NADH-dependent reductase (Old Yellow Enzyme family)